MNSMRLKKRLSTLVPYIIKVLVGVLFTSPILICFLYSFKPNGELLVSTLSTFLPKAPTLENFWYVVAKVRMQKYLTNTFIQCFSIIVCQLVFCSMAAYAIVFYRFKGKKFLWILILMSVMIPGDVIVISNYIQIQRWHLTNTHIGMALPYLVGGMGIFLMRQFYLTIPKELAEAAEIDGCSRLGFMWRFAVPLSIPSMASLAIYEFIAIYNRYFWPLLVVDKDRMRTIQLGMAYLEGGENGKVAYILAGASFCVIPAVIVFIFGQKFLVKGMTAGAVKG
ncbi:MAG: carbohydrate ABC transporter permease [Spirochaetales bacterium]|nr:carbohydrate ABC transporter permease [Spirochaetales bacterium]